MLISLTKAQILIYKVRATLLFIIKQRKSSLYITEKLSLCLCSCQTSKEPDYTAILPDILSFGSLHYTCLFYQHNHPTSCFLGFFLFLLQRENESEMYLLDVTFDLLRNQSNGSKFKYIHFDAIIKNFMRSQIFKALVQYILRRRTLSWVPNSYH